ncbi:9792_t:CDS:1, partial [Funneliformis geosporum]
PTDRSPYRRCSYHVNNDRSAHRWGSRYVNNSGEQIGWATTSHSFLFSFANNDHHSGYIERVSSDIAYQKYAVYYKTEFGPAFGSISILGNNIQRNDDKYAYPYINRILSDTKQIVDYEVFLVEVVNETY